VVQRVVLRVVPMRVVARPAFGAQTLGQGLFDLNDAGGILVGGGQEQLRHLRVGADHRGLRAQRAGLHHARPIAGLVQLPTQAGERDRRFGRQARRARGTKHNQRQQRTHHDGRRQPKLVRHHEVR
jgi:hypothetical protein